MRDELTSLNEDLIVPPTIHSKIENSCGDTELIERRSIVPKIIQNRNKHLVLGDPQSITGYWEYYNSRLTRRYYDTNGIRRQIVSIIGTLVGTDFIFHMENGLIVHLFMAGDTYGIYMPASKCYIKYDKPEWM